MRAAARLLAGHGIAGAAGDARHLMAHVLGVEPGRLILMGDDQLDPAQRDRFRQLLQRRAAREPVSHLTGRRLFHGRYFAVGPDVLDPRPETETLVAAALQEDFDTVLDLGTGSGAIVLSLLAERPAAHGVGTDLSARALDVAGRNARQLGVADRCTLVQGDWFAGLSDRFQLVVSNPPYIAAREMPGLAPELAHEPRMALTDGGDGLGAYRAIAAGAAATLPPAGGCCWKSGRRRRRPWSRCCAMRGWPISRFCPTWTAATASWGQGAAKMQRRPAQFIATPDISPADPLPPRSRHDIRGMSAWWMPSAILPDAKPESVVGPEYLVAHEAHRGSQRKRAKAGH